MKTSATLEEGEYYHIYNRGINGCNIFYEERNYEYFLEKYAFYLNNWVDTFAYCLLKNHFHLLIRVKDLHLSALAGFVNLPGLKDGLHAPENIVSKKFSDLFNSYTKSINKAYKRTGGLFESPFKRILVDNEAYFTQLIGYIHHNPQKHGFTSDYRTYPHSSYQSHLLPQNTKLARKEVLEWFGDADAYARFHTYPNDDHELSKWIIEVD